MSNDTQPEIRFPGFTEDWEQRKLGEVVKINGRIGFRGYTQADIIRKEDGGILAFSPTNIINNKLDFNVKNTYITKDKYYESPEIMVKNGDILFVKTGSTLGKSASVSNLNEEATINPQIVILRATSYFISEFISSYLISNNILKQVAQTRIGGAVPTLTETEIKRFQISAPKGKEQQKIGTLFKQLDDTIALHQRKLDLLKETKKGFLQKMFPKNGAKVPEIRFPGFTEAWELCKLGRIFDVHTDFVSNGSFQSLKNNVRFYNDENYAYMIRLQDASNNWRGPWLYTDKHGFDFLKKSTVYENDILMSDRGTIGKFFLVPKLDRPMTLSSNAVLLRSSNCNNNFIYYMLNTIDIGNQIKKRTGSVNNFV
ncbi:restriction endonuclease subunit S [Enterococcus avium]|uniref:Restriction endonuclease subunit S n=1 Tax=Enterococcus avium TaxID=33945 RepID=A0AAW8S1B9_ENTAV|nr:restriction endonuclease subunit S [Enterococcus avium]MDT2405000.1 restriction endonuclease subunit S [Enterococcus avium]